MSGKVLFRKITFNVAFGLVLIAVGGIDCGGDDFVGWRGNGTGQYSSSQPPVKWSEDSENIAWKTEIGKGYSSPVWFNDCVLLTARPADIICLDAKTGTERWRYSADYASVLSQQQVAEILEMYKKLDQEKRENELEQRPLRKSDPDSPQLEKLKQERKLIDEKRKVFEKKYPREDRGGAGNSAATILCYKNKIFAVLGTGIVVALTPDGKKIWSRHLEVPQQGFGHSASPVVAGGKIIVHIENLIALNPDDGKTIWQTGIQAKFGTPAVANVGEHHAIITPSGSIVDARDGKVLAEKQFRLSHNSPLVHEQFVYAHESGKIKAFKLPDSLDVPFELENLWVTSATSDQRMATAVFGNGLLIAAGRKGIIDVTDAKSGEIVYRQRSKMGEIFSSPVIAGGLVFLSGKDGQTLVFEPTRKFKQVSINRLQRINSLPTFHGDSVFIRTDKYVYCIQR